MSILRDMASSDEYQQQRFWNKPKFKSMDNVFDGRKAYKIQGVDDGETLIKKTEVVITEEIDGFLWFTVSKCNKNK